MNIDTGFADIDGAKIYFEVAGDGPPLVFVHGYTLDSRMWDDQFAFLATNHRVVRYDIRGFGRSDVPSTAPFSNHDDIARLLDVLDIERAHVCGLSMGGGITIDFALEYPERVRSIIVIGSALGGSSVGLGSLTAVVTAMAEAAGRGDLAAAKRGWLESELFTPANRDADVARRLREMVGDWSGWQLTNQANHVDPNPLPAHRLGQLAAPTLAIVGELDVDVIHDMATEIETNAPNVRRVVVADAGHMTNMEAPATVNDLIASFLAEQ